MKIKRNKIYQFSTLMSWFFLLASLLLLIYTYYRSEIIFGGDVGGYYTFYIISLTSIVFWVIILRLRQAFRANVVAIFISLILGVYLIEVGLIFLGLGQLNKDRALVAASIGVEYDKRKKLKVIEDLIEDGFDAVPALRPRDMLEMSRELLPLGGVSKKLTVGPNESGQWMIYPSDRYGFNNPDSEWEVGELDWLLTGDSFTEGVAVQQGEGIAGQLRKITQQSVISIGRSGSGPLIELAALKEYAGFLKPKKVLWVYYEGNDLIGDLLAERTNPILMKYMNDRFSQNLINRQKEIDNRLKKFIIQAQAIAEETALLEEEALMHAKTRWMRLASIRQVIRFIPKVEPDFENPLFTEILSKAKTMVNSWGGDLYFVYLPEYSRYKNKFDEHNQFRKKIEVIDLVKNLNIPVIDIHEEVFSNNSDPLSLFPMRLGAHYNSEGYRQVAKVISKKVIKYLEID